MPLRASQVCTLGPASSWSRRTYWLPDSAFAGGAQGVCSKSTGKTRELYLPDMAFIQKLGKTGVLKGPVLHRIADYCPSPDIQGKSEKDLKKLNLGVKIHNSAKQ